MTLSQCDSLSGIEFEQICAQLLEDRGYIDVVVTPTSGDYGIDILAERDSIPYAIQCKCYTGNIGVDAVQQAYSGAAFYGNRVPVIMTNSHFTHAAIEMAQKLGVRLWDRAILANFIQDYNQYTEDARPNEKRTSKYSLALQIIIALFKFFFGHIYSALSTLFLFFCIYVAVSTPTQSGIVADLLSSLILWLMARIFLYALLFMLPIALKTTKKQKKR